MEAILNEEVGLLPCKGLSTKILLWEIVHISMLLAIVWLALVLNDYFHACKPIKTNFFLLMLERFWIECHTANPLTPKILLIILLTACQIILIMLVWRILYRIN